MLWHNQNPDWKTFAKMFKVRKRVKSAFAVFLLKIRKFDMNLLVACLDLEWLNNCSF